MPTHEELMQGFELGPWKVLPERGLLRDGDRENRLEPKVMDVFVVLASHGGKVVTKDQLIEAVWDGRPQADEVITRCISALRHGLEDSARSPVYIETLQRRGYRVMMPVVVPEVASSVPEPVAAPRPIRTDLILIGVGFLALVLIVIWAINGPPVPGLDDDAVPDSVAVFPFDCVLDAQDPSEHLCFGFAQEAISSLKQIAGLKVVRIRQQTTTDQEGSAVTGYVQIIGDAVKVGAQLEDVQTGSVVWSDTFDADKGDIFDLQGQVANALRRALDSEFREPVDTTNVPSSYAAAEAYSLGQYLFERRDHDSTVEAIEQFELATQLDPNFGPAYLGLAYTYIIWPDYDPQNVDRAESYEKALEVVERGIDVDPGIYDASGTVYGFIHHKRNEWIAAAEAFERAINDEDVRPVAYNWYSRVLASVGRLDDALYYARRAVELDPDHPDQAIIISRLAITYFWINDLENARRYFDIANLMELEASIHLLSYSLFLIRTGEIDDAKAYAKAGLDRTEAPSDWVDPVFEGLKDGGDLDTAIATLEQVVAAARAPENEAEFPENVEMTLWMLLGETERAMNVARKLEDEGGLFELEIIFIDEFREFRQHAYFPEFVRAIGLTEYWASSGCAWSAEEDRVLCTDQGI